MTTETPKSIAEVLRPRAQLVAEMIAKRVEKENQWTGYTADEELNAELRDDGRGGKFVKFWRKEKPLAGMDFWNITLKDTVKVSLGEKIETKDDKEREERYQGKVVVPEGVEYKQDISHTFQKTTSLSEAVKFGAEIAVAVKATAEYSGIGGSVELAAKISAEYDKNMGETKTVSDTITRTLDFTEPGVYTWEALRTVEDLEREITATTSFEHSIHFFDERDIDGGDDPHKPRFLSYEWRSLEEFISAACGLAPSNVALYHAFKDTKPEREEMEKMRNSGFGTISYIAHYENVNNQDITIKKEV